MTDAPVAVADSATTSGTTKVLFDVLAKDPDPNGDAIAPDTLGLPAHGTATITRTGPVRHVADAGFTGVDSIGYPISDGVKTATATVGVTALPQLTGGPGDDDLTGGTGIDEFRFELSTESDMPGHDGITDFDVAQDRLDFGGDMDATPVDTVDGALFTRSTGGTILFRSVLAADLLPLIPL